MNVDRVLQLKLIADVSDINRKMGGVTQDTSRVKRAFGQLKSFVGPALAGIGLQLASAVGDSFRQQLQHAEDLRNALVGLEAAGRAIGLPEGKIRRVADHLRDVGVSLGVGEDAKIVSALRDITNMTGDLRMSKQAVQAIFDIMRVFDVDFDKARYLAINGLILGRSRALDELGIRGDTAADRIATFTRRFGTAAEEFAQTSEGKWQVAQAQWDGHMLNFAIIVDQAMAELKLQLIVAWNNLTGIVAGIANIWAAVDARWGEDIRSFIGTAVEVLTPLGEILTTLVLSPLWAMLAALDIIWTGVTQGFDAAADKMSNAFNGVASAIRGPLNSILAGIEAFINFVGMGIISGIEAIVRPLNDVAFIGDQIPDTPLTWGWFSVPRLAQGGIVTSPTLALVGEAGPEAVVPLDRGMGNTYHIDVRVGASSPADVGRAIVEAIQSYERRAGDGWRA